MKTGFTNTEGDCAVRAVSISMNVPYIAVYNGLVYGNNKTDCSNGVTLYDLINYLEKRNYTWIKHPYKMDINNNYVVVLKDHAFCIKEGIIYDPVSSLHEEVIGILKKKQEI